MPDPPPASPEYGEPFTASLWRNWRLLEQLFRSQAQRLQNAAAFRIALHHPPQTARKRNSA